MSSLPVIKSQILKIAGQHLTVRASINMNVGDRIMFEWPNGTKEPCRVSAFNAGGEAILERNLDARHRSE